ncbi:hypothetical protein [Hymenobacter sp. B81]|uniref:hypothetical protein n=1 Tax=Hymenobacter sp. B81 TaxID=3344878 RepID=UPI0037DCC511
MSAPVSYRITTPHPLWTLLGALLGTSAGAALPFVLQRLGLPLQVLLFIGLMLPGALGGFWLGMQLGLRREQAAFDRQYLYLVPRGWDRRWRRPRQIDLREVRSYQHEWAGGGHVVRLRLPSGETIRFGHGGQYWRQDNLAEFTATLLGRLRGAAPPPAREPTFWEGRAIVGLLAGLTLLLLALTGWLLIHGLRPGQSGWEVAGLYGGYLGLLATRWRARRPAAP